MKIPGLLSCLASCIAGPAISEGMMKYRKASIRVTTYKSLSLLVCSLLLSACAEKQQDFCQYLSLEEAQSFDPSISESKMRQTKGLLYCVWGDGNNDKLFISLDRALDYSPGEFLNVVAAQTSPRLSLQHEGVTMAGNEAAALFPADGEPIVLDMMIIQDSRHSVTIRARGVDKDDSQRIAKLYQFADMILSRL
jgi:hypothetical protein